MRFLIVTLFLFFLNNCGFTPLYNSSKKLENIQVNIKDLKGNEKINSLIIQELNKYRNNDGNKKIIDVNIDTQYFKESISKNLSGKTSKYRITIVSNFEVYSENNRKNYSFNQNSKIEAKDDAFEQNRLEEITIKNLSKIIVEKLLSEIYLIE